MIINDDKEKVKTIIDLRADCPLKRGEYNFNKAFLRKVKRVGKYLLLNEETKALYLSLCADMNEYLSLIKLFEKNF
jgi:hypothetical protein